MATLTIPNTFVASTSAASAEVNANFSAIKSFIDGEVIQKDASVAFTALISGPSSDPTSNNHLARKKYVDDLVSGLSSTYAPISHNHAASAITSGTLDANRLPNHSATLLTSGTLPAARLPNHSANLLTSGTVSNGRLPSTISGKTSIGATTLDAEGGTVEFEGDTDNTLDYGQTYAGLFTFKKTGAALGAVTLGAQGFTFPDLGLNNKIALGWDATGTGRLRVFVDGTDEGYIQLTT